MATQAANITVPEGEEFIPIARVEQEFVSFIFTCSPDHMRLFLECETKERNLPIPTSRMSLLGILPKSVPTSLLHPEVLDDIAADLSRGKASPRRRIAKGIDPIPGRDGKLVLLVKTLAKSPNHPQFIDPWFVKSFDNIEIGMPVARIYPPHPGVSGTDVLGTSLPATGGEPAQVELDETLEQQGAPDGRSHIPVVAKVDGYLLQDGKRLRVVHELTINGDVDHHTGDIEFIGKLSVRGSVKKNFRVKARDGIEIQGDVLDGILSSRDGDIVVKGHISGEASRPLTLGEGKTFQQLLRVANDKPQISCGKTLKLSVAEGVSVEAFGDIEIAKGVSSSYLRTRASVRAPQAQIIGGEIYSVCGVEAAILGTELETPTKIVLCSDRESSAEFGAIVEKLKAHESAEEMIRLYLGPYAENPTRIRLLNPEHRKKMEGLRVKLEEVQKSKAALEKQKSALLEDAQESSVFRVNFHKAVFPGVTFEAGAEHKTMSELVTGPKTVEYLPLEKRFDIVDQQPLQCNLEKKKK